MLMCTGLSFAIRFHNNMTNRTLKTAKNRTMPSFVNIMQSFWCKTLSKETEYGDIFDALFYKNVTFLVNMRRCPVFLDYTLSIKDQVNKDISSDCVVHRQAAVKLVVCCDYVVFVYIVFKGSPFTVKQCMHNVIADISKTIFLFSFWYILSNHLR